MVVGKYAGVFCHSNRQSALDYWQCCINETIRAGFSPNEANVMEKDNLSFYASQKDANAIAFVKALFN